MSRVEGITSSSTLDGTRMLQIHDGTSNPPHLPFNSSQYFRECEISPIGMSEYPGGALLFVCFHLNGTSI